MCRNSVYFLLWGWVSFVCCIGQFVLKMVGYPKHYLVWALMLPTIVASIFISSKQQKKRKAATYVDDAMSYLWTGMAVSFFVLSLLFSKLGWGGNVFPFFIMLYGLGTFVSGRFLHFTPLIVGGIIAWALAILAINVPYDYQLLCAAGAIMVSYIIPAYLLRSKQEQTAKL